MTYLWVCRYCLDDDGEQVELERNDLAVGWAEWICPRCDTTCAVQFHLGTIELADGFALEQSAS